MNFFISDALAAAPEGSADPITSLLPLVFIFVVFYFLLIRPQSKKAKEHKLMVESLAKGDEVVTNGGLLGKLTKIGPCLSLLQYEKDAYASFPHGT